MKRFHDRQGFTLIELMVTVAIMGIVVAIAMPMVTRFSRREDTRRAAMGVSGMITDARARAVAAGRMTFLLFGEPINGIAPFQPGQIAALVTDTDGDNAATAADAIKPIYLPSGTSSAVSLYGAVSSPFSAFPVSPDDLSEGEPNVDLASIADGTTLPVSAALGVAVAAFSPQGAAVAADTPAEWGTGAGGIYLTDNDSMVLAVLVMPLGSVKLQKLDAGSGEWH